MFKLYKSEGEGLRYWEAWAHEGELTTHWGRVGEEGERRTRALAPAEDPEELLLEEAQPAMDEGYAEADPEEMFTLVVQYPIQAKGTAHDFEKRTAVEELLTDALGWTGNGEVEGGEMAEGRMNVFCLVMLPEVAVRTVVQALDEEDLLEGACIAVGRGEEMLRVVWPEGFQGTFRR